MYLQRVRRERNIGMLHIVLVVTASKASILQDGTREFVNTFCTRFHTLHKMNLSPSFRPFHSNPPSAGVHICALVNLSTKAMHMNNVESVHPRLMGCDV